MKRNYFRQRVSKRSAAATYDELKFGAVAAGRTYVIQRLAVEDEDSAPTGDIRIYVDGHGYNHYELEQDSPQAATLYWSERDIVLTESETLVARITGCTSGDNLHMYLAGYWYEGSEEM